MKLKNVFIANGVLAWLYGLLFLITPIYFCGLFGITITESSAVAVRLLGAAFLGLGTVRLLVRNERDSRYRRNIVIGSCVQDTIGLAIMLHAQLTELFNPLGWISVAIYCYFCFVYWYYFLSNPDDPFLD